MEEFFLSTFLIYNELDIINQQHINIPVLIFKSFNLFMLNRMDKFVGKFFRSYIYNTVVRRFR